MQLTLAQRVNLDLLIGTSQAQNVIAMRTAWLIQDKLALSDEEKTAVEYKVTVAAQGGVRVQYREGAMLEPKSVEFKPGEAAFMRRMLEAAVVAGDLRPGMPEQRVWLRPLLDEFLPEV